VKIAGSAVVGAPRERVWEALVDPAVLGRALPGCRELEPVGADAYLVRVAGTVASVAGEYAGVVRVAERARPGVVAFQGTGAGASGAVEGQVRLVLHADRGDSTRVDYDAEGQVDGALGAVGSRLLVAFGRRVAERFLAEIGAAVEAAGAETSPEPELQQGGPAPTHSQQGGPAPTQPQQGGPAPTQPQQGDPPPIPLQQGHPAATPRTAAAFALGLLAGLGLGLGLRRRR
jgi:carbon monoxide dehydrogenase subunit G